MIRSGLISFVIAIAMAAVVQAQTSPEVGNAVVLATNSIQVLNMSTRPYSAGHDR